MTQEQKNEDQHNMGEIVRTLDRIEAQVMKTNGRVNSLEKWKWTITGATIVLAGMSIPSLSIVAKAFTQ